MSTKCNPNSAITHNNNMFLQCSSEICKKSYDIKCLGIQPKSFEKLTQDYKDNWICPDCTNNHNSSSSTGGSPGLNKTYVSTESTSTNVNNLRGSQPENRKKLDIPYPDVSQQMLTEMRDFRAEVNARFDSQAGAFQAMQQVFQEMTKDVQDLKQRVTALEEEKCITSEVCTRQSNESAQLRGEVSSLKKSWEDMEQRSRLCNLEIQNIPETEGENLVTIFDSLCTIIQTPTPRESIRAIHRIRPNTASDKPKSIIVELNSRRQRDDIIAAARVRRGITTDKLGLKTKGQPSIVYINEHLTLNNKILHSKAREFAKQNNYKYVWIKNGTILMRKTDSSKSFAVRDLSDLEKKNSV